MATSLLQVKLEARFPGWQAAMEKARHVLEELANDILLQPQLEGWENEGGAILVYES